MKANTLLKVLSIIISLSVFHVGISLLIYNYLDSLSVLAFILAPINIIYLLRYFSYTIQYLIAHKVSNKYANDRLLVFNVLLGIILNAFIIYALFILTVAHIEKLISQF